MRGKIKTERRLKGGNTTPRTSSLLWSRISCNSQSLDFVSLFSPNTPTCNSSTTFPTDLWISPTHSFPLPMQGTSSGQRWVWWYAHSAWLAVAPPPGTASCCSAPRNKFPVSPSWRGAMCLALALSCLRWQWSPRKQSHVPTCHWCLLFLWKVTVGTWGTFKAIWSAPLPSFPSSRGRI